MTATPAGASAEAIAHFRGLFQPLTQEGLTALAECYSDDIDFTDPLHHHVGRRAVMAYYRELMTEVSHCHFDFHQQHVLDQRCFLEWTMHYAHPSVRGGRTLSVAGCSHLTWRDQRVCRHRDYYDVGEMLYEQLPLIGWVVRRIKQRL
ncbi:nuclear transport factor 2 family protein [Salinicola sp. DM10]|uniref:nuclear transport factor 2 family protein n=1 Tax=Salinicola sp. DM10 TaxID=2815721 RepID=UPI001A8FE09D|nr:nuclear transport factor 2 family protein [Salinicola sp. DM10]MCE3028822.1 nuclear transport factor 2 family protein [Salinicola sp. DM10]